VLTQTIHQQPFHRHHGEEEDCDHGEEYQICSQAERDEADAFRSEIRGKKPPVKRATRAKRAVAGTMQEQLVETPKLAYRLAEREGFSRSPDDYWLVAEVRLKSV
jgi:hypothetical protein